LTWRQTPRLQPWREQPNRQPVGELHNASWQVPVANDDLSERSVLILHGQTDLLYGKRPIFPAPRPQTRRGNPQEGEKPKRSPPARDRHPQKSPAKQKLARFFWFFCGVKKGPPHHRKIDATTEK
jgi:hypothetical protein